MTNDEERVRYITAALDELRKQYTEAAQPYLNELYRLESLRKPEPLILSKEQSALFKKL